MTVLSQGFVSTIVDKQAELETVKEELSLVRQSNDALLQHNANLHRMLDEMTEERNLWKSRYYCGKR